MANEKDKTVATGAARQTRARAGAAASSGTAAADPRLPETVVETASTGEAVAAPSVQEIWETLRAVATQLTTLSAAVNARPAQQVLPDPPVAPREAERVHRPVRAEREVDYLTVLDHVVKMGTPTFRGSSDPMEADKWMSRLDRNFQATRCPEQYKKDIAVHFLEDNAYNWWVIVERRSDGRAISFSEFEREFEQKYFPVEAFDRLETAFLNLTQGNRSVREYEEEFSRLRKYVRAELDDEQVQVRRFLRGLRAEIRTHCLVRSYDSVYELVEKAAVIEDSLAEERVLAKKDEGKRTSTIELDSAKRTYDSAERPSRQSEKSRKCAICGKWHSGKCHTRSGNACAICGDSHHQTHSCPRKEQENARYSDPGDRRCYLCGQSGHFYYRCPQRYGQGSDQPVTARPMTELPPPPKRPAIAPRAYAIVREEGEPSNVNPVTGKTLTLYVT